MILEYIKEVGIDELDRLYVAPNSMKFEFIYRYAAGVNWDEEKLRLYAQKRTVEIPHHYWYAQILLAVIFEYGVDLKLTSKTSWENITDDLKEQAKYMFP